MASDLQRAAARMDRRVRLDSGTGCWIWTGVRLKSGYGRVGFRGRLWLAHRLTYTMKHGEIAAGLVLDHLCRNRACINPDHLEAVTQIENLKRIPYSRAGCTLAIRGRLYIQVKAADGKHRQRAVGLPDTPANRMRADQLRAEVVALLDGGQSVGRADRTSSRTDTEGPR